MVALHHVSEDPAIECFEPRPATYRPPGVAGDVVWAIDAAHLHNYLLPRDCPRVTFYASAVSDSADVAFLMAGTSARHVVAIESGWLEAVASARLYRYTLPPETFVAVDEGAGYYVSRSAVRPLAVDAVGDLLAALLERDVELRVMPSLWKLRDAVVASSLQYSFIRMRNARPREQAALGASQREGPLI